MVALGNTQTLTELNKINLGVIEFDVPVRGNITLSTTGEMTYGRSFSGNPTAQVGELLIEGPVGEVVEIRCRNTARLVETGGSLTLNFRNAVALPSTTADVDCRGRGNSRTIITHTFTDNPSDNTLTIGGRLITNNRDLQSVVYSSTNSGGRGADIRVVFQ